MLLNRPLATVLTLATLMSLSACGSPTTESMSESQYSQTQVVGTMTHTGHTMDLGPADALYDLRFIDGMTPHHEGALAMAEAALANSKRPEIRQLAENIIAPSRLRSTR